MVRTLTRFLFPLLLFLLLLFLYVHNLSPSVYGGDVGDVVTAAYLGGVAHPSGYPLFMLLGFLLSHIFFFTTPAFAIGLISACSGALSVVFFYLTLKRLKMQPLLAVIATAALSTNYLFWFYNEIAEVFALNTFFVILLFYLAVVFSQTKKRMFFFLFLFVLALSFTHHEIIVFFVPSFLLLIIPALFSVRRKWKAYLWAIPFFLLGLLPLLYIPIASFLHPAINWDNVHDFGSFLHLLLRKDYGTFQAGGFSDVTLWQRIIILKSYAQTLLFELTIPVCTVALLGVIQGFFSRRLVSMALLLGFVISGPVFITYAGFPLVQNFFFGVNERFFTMSAVLIFYFFAFGIEAIRVLVLKFLKRPVYALLFPAIFLLIPIQLFFYNFPKTDLSQVWIGDTLGYDVLSPLPKNAVLFLTGDTPLFNTQYMHYARHVRPDVEVVNFAVMQMNPYMQAVRKKVLQKTPSLVNQPPLLSIRMIQEVAKTRPVFSGVEVQGEKEKLTWVPYGLYYELLPSAQTIPSEDAYANQIAAVWQKLHIPHSRGKAYGSLTISEIPTMYSSAMLVAGAYFASHYHAPQRANAYYQKAIAMDPSNTKAYEIEGIYYLIGKECFPAQDDFAKAIEQNPSEELAYLLLYSTYRECFHDAKREQNIALQFKQNFGEDILVALKKTLSQKEVTF